MRIRIKALDTLFFRDGKPFTSGEETWADGTFPPYPSVLYGALRTWFITNQKTLTDDIITQSGNIKLKNIYYKIYHKDSNELCLPLPYDFVERKEKGETKEEKLLEKERELKEKTYQVEKLDLFYNQNQFSSNSLSASLKCKNRDIEVEQVKDGIISLRDFINYLQGNLTDVKIRKLKDIAVSEAKVGISRSKATNSVSESKLYRVGMKRPDNFNIILDFELPEEISDFSTFMKLGGEGKSVTFANLKGRMDDLKIDTDTIQLNEGEFKLYLATPAIFHKGWQPDLERQFEIKAELISASIGKSLNIGGFDMKENKPKPMLKAVPSGSVFYYKTTESSATILQKLQGQSISDEFSNQGFGIAYVGNF